MMLRALGVSAELANLARESAWALSDLSIWMSENLSNLATNSFTFCKYMFMLSSLASNSPFTCPRACHNKCLWWSATNSNRTARSIVVCSTSLLYAINSNRTARSILAPAEGTISIPAPLADLVEEPSTYNFHSWWPGSLVLGPVLSTMKSTNAWALITIRGSYSIPKSASWFAPSVMQLE